MQIVQGDVKAIKIHLGNYFCPMVCVCVRDAGEYSEFLIILKCKKIPFCFYK